MADEILCPKCCGYGTECGAWICACPGGPCTCSRCDGEGIVPDDRVVVMRRPYFDQHGPPPESAD